MRQKPIYLLSPKLKEGTISLPMIAFKTLTSTLDLSQVDMLMFTSKQAVKITDTLNPSWKKLPCLAVGEATAKQIKSLGGSVAHLAERYYAEVLSQEILERFKEKKILYLRPKVVSFDSKTFLEKAGMQLEEKVIYETTCVRYREENKPKKDAIIIFTSPSTINCFFQNFTWHSSYTAVVIGESTKKHLPPEVDYKVADIPTIDACILKAQSLNRL